MIVAPSQGVDLQLLGRVVRHHDRQEVEHRAPHRVDEHPGRGLVRRAEVDHAEGVQHRGERDDQRGAEQHAEQRPERVGQVLEHRVQPGDLAARLGAGGGLHVGVGLPARAHAGHLRQVHDLREHRLHGSADDDLVAVAGLRHGAHHAGHRLHGLLVDRRGVAQLEAQPGGAVGQAEDVLRPSDGPDDLLGTVARRRGRHVRTPRRGRRRRGTKKDLRRIAATQVLPRDDGG
jgi:hypothetical protein